MNQSCHVNPALIGMGTTLAAPCAPQMAQSIKDLLGIQSLQHRVLDPLVDKLEKMTMKKGGLRPSSSPSLDELAEGDAFSLQTFMSKTSQRLSLMIPQLEKPLERRRSSGGPEKLWDRRRSSCDQVNHSQELVSTHYFYSEMQFVMTLIDISDRLRNVPRQARQDSLIAELTLLNYNLPADVCIPFMCLANASQPRHHQVARIALTDCVVLNSADRVPYLLLIEVLDPLSKDESPKRRKPSSSPKLDSKKGDVQNNSSREGDLNHSKQVKQQLDENGDIEQDQKESSETSQEVESEVSIDVAQRSPSLEYHQSVLDRRHSISTTSRSLQTSPEKKSPSIVEEDEDFSERMRTAAVMLAQLYQQSQDDKARPGNQDFEHIRSRVLKEMMALEQKRLEALSKAIQEQTLNVDVEVITPLQERHLRSPTRDLEDPSGNSF